MKNKLKVNLETLDKAIERKNRISQGYFDGRFAPKKFKDKKKEAKKNGSYC